MKRERISKNIGKARKLALKNWLAAERQNRTVDDTIKLTCVGNKKLVRITGPKGTGLAQAWPEELEQLKLAYPDLEIRDATDEELNNWVTEQLNQQHFQGDAVVTEIQKICMERFVEGS